MADGNGLPPIPETADVQAPLSEFAQMHIRGVSRLEDERNKAMANLEEAKKIGRDAVHHIRRLEEEISDLKSRITVYQLERDQAVGQYKELLGVFKSMYATMREYQIPTAPVQRVAEDAEAPIDIPKLPTPNQMLDRISKP